GFYRQRSRQGAMVKEALSSARSAPWVTATFIWYVPGGMRSVRSVEPYEMRPEASGAGSGAVWFIRALPPLVRGNVTLRAALEPATGYTTQCRVMGEPPALMGCPTLAVSVCDSTRNGSPGSAAGPAGFRSPRETLLRTSPRGATTFRGVRRAV